MDRIWGGGIVSKIGVVMGTEPEVMLTEWFCVTLLENKVLNQSVFLISASRR